jgi:hypothetical protein
MMDDLDGNNLFIQVGALAPYSIGRCLTYQEDNFIQSIFYAGKLSVGGTPTDR